MISFLLAAVIQPQITVETSPFQSLYFSARSGEGALPEKVLKAGRGVSADGRGLVSGASIDARAISCKTAEEFSDACLSLPENLLPAGMAFAGALKNMTPEEKRDFGAKEGAKSAQTARQLQEFFNKNSAMVRDAAKSLGFKDENCRGRVILVPRAPAPFAITYRTLSGPVSIVGAESFSGSALPEAALHEALHAFDIQNPSPESVLSQLRSSLKGQDAKGRAEALHAVIFATAAYFVQKSVKGHKPYGESGPYLKMTPESRKVIALWTDHLKGKSSLSATIKMIADTVPLLKNID